MQDLGYVLGSDEANLALAIDEYYNRRRDSV
jgi:hypothetical protein